MESYWKIAVKLLAGAAVLAGLVLLGLGNAGLLR
jgi:hypothetical protein